MQQRTPCTSVGSPPQHSPVRSSAIWLSHSWGATAASIQSDQLIDLGQATSYQLENLPIYTLHTLSVLAEGKDGTTITSFNAGTYLTTDIHIYLPYVDR